MSRTNPKVPINAKKVFSGILFDVWQWEQEMYNGTKELFEKVARQDTVIILAVTPDKKILVNTESQPDKEKSFLSLPSGRIDEGEEPLEAAKRELNEEAGYVSNDWKLINTKVSSGKINWDVYIFLALNVQKLNESHQDPGERIVTELFNEQEFLNLYQESSFRSVEVKSLLEKANLNEIYKNNFLSEIGLR